MRRIANAGVCLLAVPMLLFGAARTWDGGAPGDNNWSNPVNWNGDVNAPQAGDDVTFSNATSSKNCVLDIPTPALRSITFYPSAANAYRGSFDFSNNQMNITMGANCDFRTNAAGSIVPNGGTLALTNNSGGMLDLIPNAVSTMPNITKAGTAIVRIGTASMAGALSITVTQGEMRIRSAAGMAVTTNSLTVNGNGALFNVNTKTLTVVGNVTLTQGTLQSGNGGSITAGGNWIKTAGTFTPNTGTVTLNATAGGKTIDACTFAGLTINASATAVDYTLNGNVTSATTNLTQGTLKLNGKTLNITGATTTAATMAITFDNNSKITMTGGGGATDMSACGTITVGTGCKISFSSTNAGTFTVPNPAQLLPPIERLGTGGSTTLSADAASKLWTQGITVTARTLSLGSVTADVDGDVNLSGTGTITAPGATYAFTVSGNWMHTAAGATFTHNSGTITLDATVGGKTIKTDCVDAFNALVFSTPNALPGGRSIDWTLDSNVIAATVTLTRGTLDLGTSDTLTITGNTSPFTADGILNLGTTSMIKFTGATVNANFNALNGFSAGTNSSICFASTAVGPQTFTTGGSGIAYPLIWRNASTSTRITNISGDLSADSIRVTAGTLASGANIVAITRGLQVDGGVFDGTSGTITVTGDVNVSSGTLTVPNSANFSTAGNWSVASGATFTPGASSTINFTATSGGKTISTGGKTFTNVAFSGSNGGWQLQSDFSTGGFSQSNGALDLGSGRTVTISGASPLFTGSPNSSLTFGSSIIRFTNAAAAVDFSAFGSITRNTGVIEFNSTAAGPQVFTPGIQTFPTIWRSGTGGAMRIEAGLNCDSLRVSAGKCTLAVVTVSTVKGVMADGGTLCGHVGNFDIGGSISISGCAVTAPGAGKSFSVYGSFSYASGSFTHNSGTISFDGSGLNNTITARTTRDLNAIVISGTGDWTLNNNMQLAGLTIGAGAGTLKLGSGLIDTLTAAPVFSGGYLDFGGSRLVCPTSMDFRSLSGIATTTAGELECNGGTAMQVIQPRANDTLPSILHTGNQILQIASNTLRCNGLYQSNGRFDLNNQDLYVANNGNFNISNGVGGASNTLIGLGGRLIDVDGSASFVGTSGNLMSMNPGNNWTIHVKLGSSLTAVYVKIGSSTASGQAGLAYASEDSSTCPGATANVGWTFMPAIVWKGVTSNVWSLPANWFGGVAPATTDVVVFDNNAATRNCQMDISDTVATITFTSGYTANFNFNGKLLGTTGNATMQTGGSVTPGGGRLSFIGNGASMQSLFPPPAGQSLPIIQQYGNAGVRINGSNLKADSLLIFNDTFDLGTGLKDTVTAIRGAGGAIAWGAGAKLAITGTTANFGPISTAISTSDTLAFNNAVSFTPNATQLFPTIKQNAASTTTIGANLKAQNMVIAAGTISMGATVDSIGDISGSGTLDFGSGTLRVGGTSINCGTLNITAGTGTLEFVRTTGTQTFTPKAGQAFPTVKSNGAGGVVAISGYVKANTINVSNGTLNLGAGPDSAGTFTSAAGTLAFGGATLRITGASADFSGLATITYTSGGTCDFRGAALQDVTSHATQSLPPVTHNVNQTLRLQNDLRADGFTQTDGTLNFNAHNVSITNNGNFSVTAGATAGPAAFSGLTNRIIAVAGSASFAGTSLANYINMNPGAGPNWQISAGTTLTASYARIDHSTATGAVGNATTSQDLLNNSSWNFAVVWTGASSSAWGTAGNWDCNLAPTAASDVTFNSGAVACNLATTSVQSIAFTSSYTGAFSFNGQTLTVAKAADFSSGGAVSGAGGLILNPTSSSYNFIPRLDATYPAITKQGAGTIVVRTNPLICSGAFSQTGGTWDWGDEGLSHSVGTIAASAGTMDFGNAVVGVTGASASFAGATVTADQGTLHLSSSGAQTLTPTGTMPAIVKTGGGTLTLGADLQCKGFTLTQSPINLATYTIATTNSGDFMVTGTTSGSTFTNLDGKTITVDGNAVFSGSASNLLNLDPAGWNIRVNAVKTLTANYATVANSDATGYAQGQGGPGCVDGHNNLNWAFSQFSGLWRRSGLGHINGGAVSAGGILYLGSSTPNKLFSINTASGATRWSYTSTYGSCSQPTYYANAGTYRVYFSSGAHLIGRADNGAYSSALFDQTLAGTVGSPQTSPDGAYVYVPYTGNLTKRDAATGANVWTVGTVANINPLADIVVFNDNIYVATTDGYVTKADEGDFSPLATYNTATSSSIDRPLMVQDSILYVQTSNAELRAVHVSDMGTELWAFGLNDASSGPMFGSSGLHGAWVPAGNKLQKIMEDATQTPQEIWNYDAAAADIVGGPVLSGWNVIYAGLSNGRYIAVDDADGTILNGHWPYYCGAADSVNAGPWIDNDAGCVMFGTNGGKLDAFPLEQP